MGNHSGFPIFNWFVLCDEENRCGLVDDMNLLTAINSACPQGPLFVCLGGLWSYAMSYMTILFEDLRSEGSK